MKLQDLLREIMIKNPSLEKFGLVLVFDLREALQRRVDLNLGTWNYSHEEFNMMLQEIRALWTKKAWNRVNTLRTDSKLQHLTLYRSF